MKNLILTALIMSSMSALANENRTLKIENVTYPKQFMTLECLDADCSVFIQSREGIKDLSVIDLNMLNKTIQNRRGRRSSITQYSLTKDTIDNINRNINEGYYGKSVGNSLVAVGAAAVDTVIAIPKGIVQLLTPKRDSRRDKSAAKRVKANLFSDLDVMKVKHKFYKEIKDYLWNISVEVNQSKRHKVLSAIEDFNNGQYYRCQVTSYSECTNGRSGKYVQASDVHQALIKCEELALDQNLRFCKLTEPKLTEIIKEIK